MKRFIPFLKSSPFVAIVRMEGVIAAGGGGVAADWGPFSQSAKRADMAAWTRAQSFCAG